MDNIEKGRVVTQVLYAEKADARIIIDQAIETDGDDTVFINELERLYNEK